MAKDTYDILRSLIPGSVFQEWQSLLRDVDSIPVSAKTLRSQQSEPFDLTESNTLSLRVDGSETFLVTFTAGVRTAEQVTSELNTAIEDVTGRSDVARAWKKQVYLSSLSGSVEVMEGNAILGFYEDQVVPALLKVIAPTVHEYRVLIDEFFDRTMDIDQASDEFKRHLGDLLGYTWTTQKSVEDQVELTKELPFIYQYKGTLPSVEWTARLHGGSATVFEPFRYIMRYEDGVYDGYLRASREEEKSYSGGTIGVSVTALGDATGPFVLAEEGDAHVFRFLINDQVYRYPVTWEEFGGSGKMASEVVSELNALVGTTVAAVESGRIRLTAPDPQVRFHLLEIQTPSALLGFPDRRAYGSFIFTDEINAPFSEATEGCRIFLPYLPGPHDGYLVVRAISSSQVELSVADFEEDAAGLFYQVLAPPSEPDHLESWDFWHQGVYEVQATIAPSTYRDDFFQFAHPKGRNVYFSYELDLEPVDVFLEDPSYVWFLTRAVQLFYSMSNTSALAFDLGQGFESEADVYEGRQTIYGVYRSLWRVSFASARVPARWSELLYWQEVSGDSLSYLAPYEVGTEFNRLVDAGAGGVDWDVPVLDFQPDTHRRQWGFSEVIVRGAGASDALPATIPIGSEVLVVNAGGTPDKDNDDFTGGSSYIQTTDWVQTNGAIEWVGSAPAQDDEYRVFYKFDPWAPFGVGAGAVPVTPDGDLLQDENEDPILSW